MSLALHTIAPAPGSRKKKFKIGRGNASGRGTTAGRGTKGQRARTGGRKKLKLRGMRQMILGFPKLRGFQSRYLKPATVSLEKIAQSFKAQDLVDLKALKSKELVDRKTTAAKIVGSAKLEYPLVFVNIQASASVKEAVQKAGGSFKIQK